MNLLFVNVTPSRELKKILTTNHFSFDVSDSLPKKFNSDYDFVAFQIKNSDALADVIRLRKALPKAWLALVVSSSHLAVLYQDLLQNKEKDVVWIKDQWESLIWFYFQQFEKFQLQQQETAKWKTRCLKTENSYAELTKSSTKLIKQFEKDVDLASNIQRSLLPKVSPEIPGVSISVKYIPAAGLGGDYYDLFEFGDRKRYGVLLADSKTHGMAAALLSVLLKVRLEEMKERFPDSKSFVEFINHEIPNFHKGERASLSLFYGILDRSTLSFQYTIAGVNTPLLWRAGKLIALESPNNPPLGTMDHFDFRENSVSLLPGDLLILHTDGLHEPLGHNQTEMIDKIIRHLEKKSSPDPLEIQNELMALIDKFVENKSLNDDLTLIHFAVQERALYVAHPALVAVK